MQAERLLLIAALLLAACASHPKPAPFHPSCGIGWDDCDWQRGLDNA